MRTTSIAAAVVAITAIGLGLAACGTSTTSGVAGPLTTVLATTAASTTAAAATTTTPAPAPPPATATATPLPATTVAAAAGSNLHTVNWKNVAVPGQFCEITGTVQLSDAQATAVSTRFGHVHVSQFGAVVYGDLTGDGHDDAAVPVWCDNGSGTADGDEAQGYVVFDGATGTPTPIGTVTPQQQPAAADLPISSVASLTISSGRIVASEVFYTNDDSTCCPSGTARTIWTYAGGHLTPGAPTVTS
jgi:hypothetical protein